MDDPVLEQLLAENAELARPRKLIFECVEAINIMGVPGVKMRMHYIDADGVTTEVQPVCMFAGDTLNFDWTTAIHGEFEHVSGFEPEGD
jgi:hypothetical protein